MHYDLTPGHAIQAVLDTALPGDVLHLAPGTYYERLVIRTPQLTLEGEGGAVLHGGTPVSGWVPAPEVGSGVYKATLPFTPWAMTDAHGAVWRINNDTMQGLAVYGCLADGFAYLRQPAEGKYTGNIGETVDSYWDGIGALFGVKGSTTYVRYQYGDDPNTTGLTAAPTGATVQIAGVAGVTVQGLTILGGENQVWMTGSAAGGTIVRQCRLLTGRRRVLIDQGAHDTLIEHCDLFSGSQGFDPYWPGEGDRTSADYALVVKAHIYNENKFCVGRTTEDDTGVYLNSGPGNQVVGCTIHDGVVGVRCEGGGGHLLDGNQIARMSAQGIWLVDGAASALILRNQFEDADHLIRIQACQSTRTRQYCIGLNTFWQPRPDSQSPKHLHTSFEGCDGTTVQSTAVLWVYHNSFAGGGWAIDAGRTSGDTQHTLPLLRCVNNICSSYGIASSGGNAPGVWAYNWSTRSSYPDAEEGNVWGDGTRLWDDTTCPDFQIPATPLGATAATGALDVAQAFTLDGVLYPPLPGVEAPLDAFGAPPLPPPDPPDPEPAPPPQEVTYLVTALLAHLVPGTYDVGVQVTRNGMVLAEATTPVEVPQPATPPPTVTPPQVQALPARPDVTRRRR